MAVVKKTSIKHTDDCVCILVKIFHALLETPETADAAFQAEFCTSIFTTFTS